MLTTCTGTCWGYSNRGKHWTYTKLFAFFLSLVAFFFKQLLFLPTCDGCFPTEVFRAPMLPCPEDHEAYFSLNLGFSLEGVFGGQEASWLYGHFMAKTSAIWPFEFHRASFDEYILGGGPGSVKAFWDRMPPRPIMHQKANWKNRVVPLALHGDGVSVSNIRGKGSKTMDTLSWTSLLSSASSRVSVFWSGCAIATWQRSLEG